MIRIYSVKSLRRRILVATFGSILFFLLLAGIALDKAFQRIIRSNIEDQLQNLAFSLLTSTHLDPLGNIVIPQNRLQSELTVPESGLIALVIDREGQIVWRSPSSLGENLPLFTPIAPGVRDFQHNKYSPGLPFIYSFGSVWGNGDIYDRYLTFVVVQYKGAYDNQIKDYRETIVQWLGGGSMLILLIHLIIILVSLRPLKRVVREIDAIEDGSSDHIQGNYPSELSVLTKRINRFIRSEREQLAHYRHGLDDLAHSLKTPLAVIRGMEHAEALNPHETRLLQEQVGRMTDIIDYQLKRAASVGRHTLGADHTPLCPIIEKTFSSLDKVYADKHIQHQISCKEGLTFPGDKDDLYEIVGNISDNAYKWAKTLVRINSELLAADKNNEQAYLVLSVEDDGPGFSLASQQQITERGVRADEEVPGQGIGLAVVQNIVRSYKGELHTGKSELGGALIRLSFPL